MRRVEKRLTLHIANHAWAWLCLWNNPASACCPTHLGPAQSGTRFASHTLAWEEAAQDKAHYDHRWEPYTHTHTYNKNNRKWHSYDTNDQIWCNIAINESFIQQSNMEKLKRILTDTRHVSGWPLAVRGDRADGTIIFYNLLRSRWPQSCAVQTLHTRYFFWSSLAEL